MRIDTSVVLPLWAMPTAPPLCGGRNLSDDIVDVTYDYLSTAQPAAGAYDQVRALTSDGVQFSSNDANNASNVTLRCVEHQQFPFRRVGDLPYWQPLPTRSSRYPPALPLRSVAGPGSGSRWSQHRGGDRRRYRAGLPAHPDASAFPRARRSRLGSAAPAGGRAERAILFSSVGSPVRSLAARPGRSGRALPASAQLTGDPDGYAAAEAAARASLRQLPSPTGRATLARVAAARRFGRSIWRGARPGRSVGALGISDVAPGARRADDARRAAEGGRGAAGSLLDRAGAQASATPTPRLTSRARVARRGASASAAARCGTVRSGAASWPGRAGPRRGAADRAAVPAALAVSGDWRCAAPTAQQEFRRA
jgi:hypothetical protein